MLPAAVQTSAASETELLLAQTKLEELKIAAATEERKAAVEEHTLAAAAEDRKLAAAEECSLLLLLMSVDLRQKSVDLWQKLNSVSALLN